jgi:hypothetical protein
MNLDKKQWRDIVGFALCALSLIGMGLDIPGAGWLMVIGAFILLDFK